MGYTSTTLPHLRIEHKELEGDFRFLPRVSNGLTSFLSPGLSTISFRTSKQFIVFRVVYFTCLKITVLRKLKYQRRDGLQEPRSFRPKFVIGSEIWVGISADWNQKMWTKYCTFSDRLKSVTCLLLLLRRERKMKLLSYSRYFEPYFIRKDRPRLLSCPCALNSWSFTT